MLHELASYMAIQSKLYLKHASKNTATASYEYGVLYPSLLAR